MDDRLIEKKLQTDVSKKKKNCMGKNSSKLCKKKQTKKVKTMPKKGKLSQNNARNSSVTHA